ncbi:unnamed protein product [Blepharisma stoltei]|uniref:Uncharacterized protein n=1 Tax=Blepharisma stoltei TaxID=1481888 RepID=A0AAU9JE06_9CILI|nr:unnamed protein product [Blepharisma stoltei]
MSTNISHYATSNSIYTMIGNKFEISPLKEVPAKSILENMFSLLNPQGMSTDFNVSTTKLLPQIDFTQLEDCGYSYPIQNPLPDSQSQSDNKICTHRDRKIYARNMCNQCYRKFGQNKTAWACPHKDRQHYAKGYCQLCYLKEYHRSKLNGRKWNKSK